MIGLWAELRLDKLDPRIILIVVFLIPSLLFLFSPGLIGYDSYYFLNFVCDNNTAHYYEAGLKAILEFQLFSLLPCDVFILKLMLVFLFLINLIFIRLFVQEMTGDNSWISLLFVCITPALITISFKFENDAFGIPLIFIGLWFLAKYFNERSRKWLFSGLGFIGLGSLFWSGGVYYVLFFSIIEPLLLAITIPFIYIFFGTIVGNTFGLNFRVMELIPFAGVFHGVFYLSWIYKSGVKLTRREWLFFLPVILLGLINMKFFILSVPFLVVLMVKLVGLMSQKQKNGLIGYAIFLTLFFPLMFMTIDYTHYPPKSYEHQAVKDLVRLGEENDMKIDNDWSLGHLVWYYGGETESHSSFRPEWEIGEQDNTFILSRYDVDCELLKIYDWRLDGFNLTLYRC